LVVGNLLKKMGMVVSVADNGEAALALYDAQPFDVILMDIQMPVMDGYRATAEIRNHRDHAKRDVPIIALTASAYLSKKEKAQLFGMNDHVGKPFQPTELLEKISHSLALR
jgi:CheY-like chemotaxis protein